MRVTLSPLDLNRLEDADTIIMLGDEPCDDLDGNGTCYCAPAEEPDPLRTDMPRHMVFRGLNADGTEYASKRYFRL